MSKMDLKKLKNLIKGYEEGTLTTDEFENLENWFHNLNYKHKNVQDKMSDTEFENKLFQTFQEKLHAETNPTYTDTRPNRNSKPMYIKWLSIAASITVLAGIWFMYSNEHKASVQMASISNKIGPGGSKAFLTLSNGTSVALDKLADGHRKTDQGYHITKKKGKVIYEAFAQSGMTAHKPVTAWNTITTPNGGEFEIKLPDGSVVWLNAKSSLRFPLTFTAQTREVFLTGEAYFEVAKLQTKDHKKLPFKVITEDQSVEVLGTHFNINSYQNQKGIKTTLLEGSVRVVNVRDHNHTNAILLKPGQQSTFIQDQPHILVERANIDEAMAWKNGYFMFVNRDLKYIMQELERWYDVSVDYNNLPDKKFNGNIPRTLELAKMLLVIKKTSGYGFIIKNIKTANDAVERRLVMDK